MRFLNKAKIWLLPAVIALFVLEIITFPMVVSLTYAGRSENPEHILTYRTGKLVWDDDTKVNGDGVGELTLFDAIYQNVGSDQSDTIFAPGTEGDNIVRLKNSCGNAISYTAVMYTIRSASELPVVADMNGDGFDTENYPLPDGVGRESVVKALEGSLSNGQIADFTIDWHWLFEEGDEQDIIDTALGNRAAKNEAENIVMGVYIVVEDNGTHVDPVTGDNTPMAGYITLMVISLVILLLLLVSDRKRKADERKFG